MEAKNNNNSKIKNVRFVNANNEELLLQIPSTKTQGWETEMQYGDAVSIDGETYHMVKLAWTTECYDADDNLLTEYLFDHKEYDERTVTTFGYHTIIVMQ